MNCHIAMAVISRTPLPHAQAGRRPRLICYLHRCVHQTDNTRHTYRCAWSYSIIHETSHSPTKPLCDARAIELGSHCPAQPTTAAREVPQSGHLGIALHPPVRPASHGGSPSPRSTTVVQSAAAPTWLWATPCRRALGMVHIVGQRYTCASTPALYHRTRCTLAEVSTERGHGCLRSVETTGPAKYHCRPRGSGEVHPPVHGR